MPARILLTGLPGTGKSTLATAAAEALDLPVVAEAATDLGAAGVDISPSSGWLGLTAISVLQAARERRCREGFVADRGAIDMWAFAIARSRLDPGPVGELMFSAISELSTEWFGLADYDLVVYCKDPCGSRGVVLKRNQAEFLQLLDTCFRRVFVELGIQARVMPSNTTVADRVDLLHGWLDEIAGSESCGEG